MVVKGGAVGAGGLDLLVGEKSEGETGSRGERFGPEEERHLAEDDLVVADEHGAEGGVGEAALAEGVKDARVEGPGERRVGGRLRHGAEGGAGGRLRAKGTGREVGRQGKQDRGAGPERGQPLAYAKPGL
jgi:hypothetical protein